MTWGLGGAGVAGLVFRSGGGAVATCVVSVNDVLDGHVGLDLGCFDRIYLNGWVPTLQVPTEDLAGLQELCDTLESGMIRVFCERWWARLPLPLTEADRAAGYWWDIAMTAPGCCAPAMRSPSMPTSGAPG